MIVVFVEYNQDYQVTHPRYQHIQVPYFHDETLFDLRDRSEAIAGDVFEEEQSHIDVRVIPMGFHDTMERPLCFTIDVSEDTVHHDLDALARQFVVEIKAQIPDIPPFSVWVRRVAGAYTESN